MSTSENDSAVLLRELGAGVVPALSRVRGPWALAYFDAPRCTLWFGRDVLGRRSLLVRHPTAAHPCLLLASAVPCEAPLIGDWLELPPGIYSLALGMPAAEVQRHDWADSELAALQQYHRLVLPNTASSTASSADHAAPVLAALDAAVARRVVNAKRPGAPPGAASVVVLFSGGLDSALLAALAHRHVPADEPIDLATVCFAGGASADRLAAHTAIAELRAWAPSRLWRLIEVDCSLADVAAAKTRLLRLLHPRTTVMDSNIGSALWLAARADGLVNNQPYVSAARVCLLGTGADEQAAGYSRHRAAFVRGGDAALALELEADVRRLWDRNLGRDDRLIADNGREARHPFLDEEVMAAIRCLPLAALADLTRPPGEGDKLVLRNAARLLGLFGCAERVKRAIQFGTGLGRLVGLRDHGSTRAARASGGGSRQLETGDNTG